LRGILDERALAPVGAIGARVRDVRILNKDDKTVVRARIEEGTALAEESGGREDGSERGGAIRLVYVLPVRGYNNAARRFVRYLEKAGLEETPRSAFETAVNVRGRKPGDYSSKLRISLDPASTAQEAAGLVFGRLLDTMERNERGIREDIDTEFLHDFRVAVRRTRSGLSQIKGIFPSGIVEKYGSMFAVLGKSTNRLRDLDVYLLNRDNFMNILEEDLRPALDPLFVALAEERDREHKAVIHTLGGREYQTLKKEWRELLDSAGSPALEAKNAGKPATDVARRFISKWYERVTTAGGRVNESSPDAQLHALRIDCKKLRYLLEFFSSLFPREEIGEFVRQLKRLQDNLGEFNDLSVQLAELKSRLRAPEAPVTIDTAAAIGALIARLEDRQKKVRSLFSRSFAAFSGRENAKRYKRLFGGA
jgi:CHAD domain-containing protein